MFIAARAFLASIPGMIIAGLSAVIIGLSLWIWGLQVGPLGFKGLREQVHDYRQVAIGYKLQLDEAAKQSERQKAETSRAMGEVRNDEKAARSVSDRIRNAAPTKNCDTPSEVLGAEL